MTTTFENFKLALPHPFNTRYSVQQVANSDTSLTKFQLQLDDSNTSSSVKSAALPKPLHNSELLFTSLSPGDEIPLTNNTQWARARRSSSMTLEWEGIPPTIGQVWLFIYLVLSIRPETEQFRLSLSGENSEKLGDEINAVGLAIPHPRNLEGKLETSSKDILVQRSAFWQGAGSPFGPRSIWLADSAISPLSHYPTRPLTQTITNKFPSQPIYALHPVRPAKPTPGSVIYSRYIPHLQEHFSMVALDYHNSEHLELFHAWQNDPRVAAGWNETGTLDEHREYLRRLQEDTHTLTVLARFEDTFFAYFEIYWGAEDTLGAHYQSSPYDRGRHSLVGNASFRGPHRVSAWWSSLMHYMFLDEPRTESLIGEPKATNTRVLAYDLAHGFHVEKWVDYPHKRSAFVRCGRERFFELCPFEWKEGVVEKADEFYTLSRGSKL